MDDADQFVHRAVGAYACGRDIDQPPLDDLWVERARLAGVLAPLTAAMRRQGVPYPDQWSTLPASVTARHLRSMHDLSVVGAVFDRVGLPYAVTKGPTLSEVIFKVGRERDYTDLDVLVPPDRIGQALDVLIDAGARLLPADWVNANRARTAEVALELAHGTVLDLHWNLINSGARRDVYGLETATLLASRVEREVDGFSFWTLADVDLVLHVLLHACLSGGASLRWLLDAQQCTRWGAVSPDRLAVRARELGLIEPSRAVLDRVAVFVDPDVASWAAALGPHSPWTAFLSRIGPRFPPSDTSHRRSAGLLYSSTRPTASRSFWAMATTQALAGRRRRQGWTSFASKDTQRDDPGLVAWVASSSGQGPRLP